MAAFNKTATIIASTKRPPATSGGRRGPPAAHLVGLHCTPLDPLGEMAPELKLRLQPQNTPHELLQTQIQGSPDIIEGDVLVVGDVEYPIRAVDDWTWKGSRFVRLIVEQLKR